MSQLCAFERQNEVCINCSVRSIALRCVRIFQPPPTTRQSSRARSQLSIYLSMYVFNHKFIPESVQKYIYSHCMFKLSQLIHNVHWRLSISQCKSIQPVLKVSFNKDKISIFDDNVLALAVEKVETIPFLFKMMFSSYYILSKKIQLFITIAYTVIWFWLSSCLRPDV